MVVHIIDGRKWLQSEEECRKIYGDLSRSNAPLRLFKEECWVYPHVQRIEWNNTIVPREANAEEINKASLARVSYVAAVLSLVIFFLITAIAFIVVRQRARRAAAKKRFRLWYRRKQHEGWSKPIYSYPGSLEPADIELEPTWIYKRPKKYSAA